MTQKLREGCYFITCGGADEIGMNLNLFGVTLNNQEEWIVVDAGVSMRKELGLNLVMPSFHDIVKKNITAIVLTHAHEDHIGAVPFLLKALKTKPPIFATSFTARMVQRKLKEHKINDAVIKIVPINAKVIHNSFEIDFIYITHSIPEPNMLKITFTPFAYSILHTGDWKFDEEPVLGPVTDKNRIANIGQEGIDALIVDSTNALEENRTPSEGFARQNLYDVISKIHARKIFVSCFASNVARVKSLMEIAKRLDRRVLLLGRSLEGVYKIALEEGLIEKSKNVSTAQMCNNNMLQKSKLLIICTGSQGEKGAVLHHLAYKGGFSPITVEKDDVVIFSSRVIPGNEIAISDIKNKLIRRGVCVIDRHEKEIHVSGHPSIPEIKEMLALVAPKNVIPVHGDATHLKAIKDICLHNGFQEKHIIVPHNGAVISLNKTQINIIDTMNVAPCATDGYQLVSLSSKMLQTRQKAGEHGVISIAMNREAQIVSLSINGVIPHQMIKAQNLPVILQEDIFNMIRRISEQKVRKTNYDVKERRCSLRLNNQDKQIYLKDLSHEVAVFFESRYKKSPIVIIHLINSNRNNKNPLLDANNN